MSKEKFNKLLERINYYLELKETDNFIYDTYDIFGDDAEVYQYMKYTTNLQQENKQLKEELKNKPDVLNITRYLDIIREYLKEIDRLQQKIDKALKYIDEFSYYYADDDGTPMFVIEEEKEETFVKDLLQILGDKKNE